MAQNIEVACPQCGAKATARVGKLKRQADVVCACGARLRIDAKQLVAGLDQIDKALARLGRKAR